MSAFIQDGDILKIPLPNYDKFAIVDKQDEELVKKCKRWTYVRGYVQGHIRGRGRMFLHRLIMGLRKYDGKQIDHINRDPLDNRRENLRIATPSENNRNRNGYGSSKHRGVSWNKASRKWQAVINIEGKLKHIGYFTNEEDAAKAYNTIRNQLES